MHVIGPELGLTQPGTTIACGDSHTSTHGAFGAVAFGIGTSQVRDVLATQCLALPRPKVRRIEVTGKLAAGVYAKDVILAIIRQLGVHGGVGYAYEYAGPVIEAMTLEERLTVCNMSIEGGARCGYVNPDEATIAYLAGRPFAPQGADFERAAADLARDGERSRAPRSPTASRSTGGSLAPSVTWGINPGQSVGVDERLPKPALDAHAASAPRSRRPTPSWVWCPASRSRARRSTSPSSAPARTGASRICARRRASRAPGRVAPHVRALVVPGSQAVARQAVKEGLDEVFRAAGFEWREAGCSMCLAMNPDKLVGREMCASSSNRNFKGRQGSPTGRTLLMSPAMVAAAALRGRVSDVREIL